MDNVILRTLVIFFCVFGFILLINILLSLREKKTDVWRRVLGWLIVLPTFIISGYFGGVPFLIVVMLIVSLGAIEFYSLAEHFNIKTFRIIGITLSSLLPVIAFWGGSEIFHIAVILFVMIILALPIYKRQIKKDLSIDIHSCSATILGILYVGWASSYLVLIRNMDSGLNYLLFFYLLMLSNDIFSYYAGKFFGKTRIFTLVSPSKTLEGSVLGFAITLCFAYLLRYLIPALEIWYALLLGIIIVVSGQIGDLVESSLKREANIKDTGKILPGFGGILDRFDSLIFASPIVYFFLIIVSL